MLACYVMFEKSFSMTGKVTFCIQTGVKCYVYMVTVLNMHQFCRLDITKLIGNNVSLLCYVWNKQGVGTGEAPMAWQEMGWVQKWGIGGGGGGGGPQ